jgi:TrmH family RNA methyltransferase
MLTSQRKILAQLAARHGQKKSPFFAVEGLRCATEAWQRRPDWLEFAVATEDFLQSDDSAKFHGLPAVTTVSQTEFRQLTETETPQGILLVMRKPENCQPKELPAPCTLILDRLQEPGNVGTILRTAWALGMTSVWLTVGSADAFAPKVVRAGMGAQFALDLWQVADLAAAKAHFLALGGQELWCAMPQGETSLFSDDFRPGRTSAIVIGNEANGISRPDLGRPVTIPMPGHAESLNAAQAATVLLFEILRKNLCE